MHELFDNEVLNRQDLYDGVGLTEVVKKFFHDNATKAFMNLSGGRLVPALSPESASVVDQRARPRWTRPVKEVPAQIAVSEELGLRT